MRNVAGNGSLEDEVVLSADRLVAHSYDFGTNCNILVAEILADGGVETLAGDDVVVADELCGELRRRRGVEVNRRAGLLNSALVEQVNSIGHNHCFILVVSYEYGGDVQLLLNSSYLNLEVVTKQCVDCRKRFVKKQNLRFGYHCSCKGNALLLTAGKLHWELVYFL